MGQYDLGLGYIRRAIALAPGEARFHYNLGRALLLGGQARAAADAFGEAARLQPDYVRRTCSTPRSTRWASRSPRSRRTARRSRPTHTTCRPAPGWRGACSTAA
jgi:tetratricopeptide (TPR) repeat protein